MKKSISVILVCVLVAAFIIGALTPVSHAAAPKRCWYDCIGGHYLYCCFYVVKGGSFTQCTDTGYFCAS